METDKQNSRLSEQSFWIDVRRGGPTEGKSYYYDKDTHYRGLRTLQIDEGNLVGKRNYQTRVEIDTDCMINQVLKQSNMEPPNLFYRSGMIEGTGVKNIQINLKDLCRLSSHLTNLTMTRIPALREKISAAITFTQASKDDIQRFKPQVKSIIEEGVHEDFYLEKKINQKMIQSINQRLMQEQEFAHTTFVYQEKIIAVQVLSKQVMQTRSLITYFNQMVGDCFGTQNQTILAISGYEFVSSTIFHQRIGGRK